MNETKSYDTNDDIYVLYDVDRRPEGKKTFDAVVKEMEARYEEN